MSASPLMKALHNLSCHLIFGFWRVSLAEYIPVLRVYFPLLQMICFTKASARAVSTQRVTKTRSLGRDHPLCTFLNAFAEYWSVRLVVVFEQLVCYASATLWTRFVIICDSVCVSEFRNYLWIVNVWCAMLNDVILVVSKLVWNPSWFRLTTGIVWAQVRKFGRFGACFCTCALIIWWFCYIHLHFQL
jgi:hypothetical protein